MPTMTTLALGHRHARLTDAEADLVGRYDHVSRLPNRVQFNEDFPPSLPARRACSCSSPSPRPTTTTRCCGPSASPLPRISCAPASIGCAASCPRRAALPGQRPQHRHHPAPSCPRGRPARRHRNRARLCRAAGDLRHSGEKPRRRRPPAARCPAQSRRSPARGLVAAQDSRRTPEGFAFYDNRTDAKHLRGFRLLSDLPAAIAAPDQLSLVYQPRQALGTDRCHSAEALIRWNHPEFGFVSPGEFIPLVEQTALIAPLTEWVCRTAVDQARASRPAARPSTSRSTPPRSISPSPALPISCSTASTRRASNPPVRARIHRGDPCHQFHPRHPATGAAARGGRHHRPRRFRLRLFQPRLPALHPGRRHQDRPELRAPLMQAGDDEFLLSRIVDMTRAWASASAPKASRPAMPMTAAQPRRP